MRELTKFYTYLALFKEYKNINFVIKRNMVESNKVTWMEPELCRDKLFFKLAGECLCFQFFFNFNCLHFFSQFLLHFAQTDAFTGTSNLKESVLGKMSELDSAPLYLSFSLL